MSSTLSEDVVGNDVIDAAGEDVGIVTAVEGGTLYVDPDPALTEQFVAKLGWDDTDGTEYSLRDVAVEAVTDEKVYLQYRR